MQADAAIAAEVTTVAQGQLGDEDDARAHRLALPLRSRFVERRESLERSHILRTCAWCVPCSIILILRIIPVLEGADPSITYYTY